VFFFRVAKATRAISARGPVARLNRATEGASAPRQQLPLLPRSKSEMPEVQLVSLLRRRDPISFTVAYSCTNSLIYDFVKIPYFLFQCHNSGGVDVPTPPMTLGRFMS